MAAGFGAVRSGNVADVQGWPQVVSADGTVPADRGTRLVAAILDGIVASLIMWGPFSVSLLIAGVSVAALSGGANPGAAPGNAVAAVLTLLPVIGFIAWCWITIYLVQRNGQTIAKRMMGIKVVRMDGSPVSLGRIFWMRNVLNTLLYLVPFYGFVDILMIFGEQRRCVHDLIADTKVIKA